MKLFRQILSLILIIPLTVFSQSNGKEITRKQQDKEIKTKKALEHGQVIFENKVALIHFDKTAVLKIFLKELNSKSLNNCNTARINNFISQIKESSTEIYIFPELGENIKPADKFEVEFQGYLLDKIVQNLEIAVFNKSKKEYESKILHRKISSNNGYCMTELIFANEDKLIETTLSTDIIIIEDCNK